MLSLFTRLLLVGLFLFSTLGYSVPLRVKIGQMILLGFDQRELTPASDIANHIKNHHLGGVIFSIEDMLAMGKDKTPFTVAEIARISKTLQSLNKQSEKTAHLPELPLFVATDLEGGRIDRFRTVEDLEPTLPAALYPSLSPKKLKHELHKIAQYLKRTGFNLDFAPVLDINTNPHNPIIGRLERSYSDKPELVTQFAEQFARTLRKQHIQCTYKHFPGHGSADNDSHLGFVDVTRTWHSFELFPYQFLFTQPDACQVVMTAHVVNKQLDPSGLPATLSYTMLTKVLRNHLHFQGVIISDDMQMKAIRDRYTTQEAATLAINAGVDMLLYSEQEKFPFKSPGELIDMIEAQVKKGIISEQRINEAYQRIVALKKHM